MTDPAVLAQILETRAAQVWTALPGIVRSYDATTHLASVQPAVQDFHEDEDGERTDRSLPVIPDVPVAWPGGAGQYFHPGLTAGDEVLLVFASLDPSVWQRTGSVSKAADLGRHAPAHAFAVPCVYSRGKGPPAAPGLKIQQAQIGGTVSAADAAALASKVATELTNIAAALDTIAAAVPVTNPYTALANNAATIQARIQSALLKVNS